MIKNIFAGLRGLDGPPGGRRLRRRRPGLRSWFVGPRLRRGVAAARRAWRGGARAEASHRRAAAAGDVCVISLAIVPRRRRRRLESRGFAGGRRALLRRRVPYRLVMLEARCASIFQYASPFFEAQRGIALQEHKITQLDLAGVRVVEALRRLHRCGTARA